MKMKIKGYYDAERSQYETPVIDTVILSPEGMLCTSGEECNAFNDDFDEETNWTW